MFRQPQFLALLRSALAQPADDREDFVYAYSGDLRLAREVLLSLEEMENFDGFLERPVVVELAEAGLL